MPINEVQIIIWKFCNENDSSDRVAVCVLFQVLYKHASDMDLSNWLENPHSRKETVVISLF